MIEPTPYPEINGLLIELLRGVQGILGTHFIGMYIDGSLALGDFDQDSDVDFVVASDVNVVGDFFTALQALHERISGFDSPFAIELEGFYVTLDALRRFDPVGDECPHIGRGRGERLKMVRLGPGWQIHQWVLRNHGIALTGPPPESLIDPLSNSDLRRATLPIVKEWCDPILAAPDQLTETRGWQSCVVLTMCRILYTLEHGTIVSKRAAAQWAQATFGEPWSALIERAWQGRHIPATSPLPGDVDQTLAWIRFSIEHVQGNRL